MARKKSDDPLDLTPTEVVILYTLRTRPRYGLEITEVIEQASMGKRKIGFSSLYPTLKRLEEKEFVTSNWGDETPEELNGARRRYYSISNLGREALEEREKFLKDLTTVIAR